MVRLPAKEAGQERRTPRMRVGPYETTVNAD